MALRLAASALLRPFGARRVVQRLGALPRQGLHARFSSGGPREDMSPEAVERVKALTTSITSNVAEGVAEMKSMFGDHAVPLWMNDYYKHGEQAHKYIVPAISIMSADQQAANLPSVAAKNAVFLATVLAALPRETASRYLSTAAMASGTDIAFLLAVVSLMRNDLGADLFRRLASSARRSGSQSLTEVAQRLAAVPIVPVVEWADPLDDPTSLHQHWAAAPASGPRPFEVTAWFGAARDVLPFQDYLLLSATTVLEAQWALFYATGSPVALRRVLDIGRHWAHAGAHLPNAVNLVVNISEPLPAALTAKSTEPEAAANSVRLQVGRIALWSLLQQSRRHKAIPDAVVAACAELTEHLVEPDLPPGEDATAAASVAVAGARPPQQPRAPWSETMPRMEVFPALLHLMARSRLDMPFGDEAPAPVEGASGTAS